MSFLSNPKDALATKQLVAETFAIKEASTRSTAASRSSMSSIFSQGVKKVIQGQAQSDKDREILSNLREFADKGVADRMLQIRNLFLKAIVMTFPKIELNAALAMASVKALLTYRESGGCVSWNLESSKPFVSGKTSGWKNMNSNQRYNGTVSGTGLIQWTADRHISFLNRMSSLKDNGFDTDLAFIDPVFQSLYWVNELADKAGIAKTVNPSSQQGGVFFSDSFANVLMGKESATVGEIYGAFMLWQAGAGFGLLSENERRALIYGQPGMNMSTWTGGLTAYDLYTGYRLGLNGFYNSNDSFTINDFCKGIDRLVRKSNSNKVPFKYTPKTSYFYKQIVGSQYKTFAVSPDQDLLEIFNLK